MANELRVRALGVGGLVENNPLAVGDTTLTSAGLAALPVIDTTNHCAIILDPDGVDGAPEVVWVTAHSSSATSATIARGKEGTTARQHVRDMPWVHGPTPFDFGGSQAASGGLLAVTSYRAGSDVAWANTTSATYADIDATNGKVTFIAPPSGKVLVKLGALCGIGAAATVYNWNLRDGGGDIAGTGNRCAPASTATDGFISMSILVTGLTAGTSYTYKWGHARLGGSGTCTTYTGPNFGAAVMEVWSA